MAQQQKQYSPAKLQHFKGILEEKLTEVTRHLEESKTQLQKRKERAASENAGFSEGSKHFQEQAKDKREIRRLQTKSRNLKAALKRVEDGTYGVCTRTGELIREARLEAMPTATFDLPVRKNN